METTVGGAGLGGFAGVGESSSQLEEVGGGLALAATSLLYAAARSFFPLLREMTRDFNNVSCSVTYIIVYFLFTRFFLCRQMQAFTKTMKARWYLWAIKTGDQ